MINQVAEGIPTISLIFYLIVITVIILIIRNYRVKKMGAIHSNKCHYFDKLQFSGQEFYALLENIIKERQMPDTKTSRVEYHQKHIFSNKREYLRIQRKDDIFDVCAAPFGTGFFVSYWHGEPKKRIRDMAMKTPFLATAVEGWQGTTFYQIDTASMFKACFKDSLMEAIEQITTSKGIRGLSDGERLTLTA
jgi:hypothetical protein